MIQFTLFSLYLLVIIACTAITQNQVQMADFQIFEDTQYVASEPNNFITNITGNSVYTLVGCAQKCLGYALCETAMYYIQAQICSLFRERYGLGQFVIVGAQTTSVISVNYRNPPVTCCASIYDGNIILLENQFIYSSNQLFAAGMRNYIFGVYNAYANGSIGSALWQITQSSTPVGSIFAGQMDGNLVLYVPGAIWSSWTQIGGGGLPYCLNVLDTGHLVWLDNINGIIWSS